jgi:NAD(P)-dependent dehydrogenase (short-subunit alcohol dehydrogenase family)
MTLDGKVAIITGAAGGIGTAVATAMAQAGAKVSLVDHDERALQPVVLALRGRGFDVIGHVADVATPEGNREVVEDTISAFGRVDIFHANAGVAPFADLLQTTREDIDRTLAVNLVGAIHGCAAVLPAMVGQRSGVLLLTASIAAYVGDPLIPVYSASKGGLTALCRSLAVRHAPDGIRCVTICPGDVRTPMLEAYLARSDQPEAARSALTDRYPTGRLIEPAEIGRLAVFLASDDARSITGTDVVIDGGLTARCY